MRSSTPIPGNPWPHDMTITVEDAPHVLLELLWVREAWGLRPPGDDLPPSLVDTPAPEDGVVDVELWSAGWAEVWRAAVRHAGEPRERGWMERLRATADGSAERADALARLIGPSWRDRFGDVAFTERFSGWSERLAASRHGSHAARLEEQPERRSLDALIAAWEAGLTTVVTIPVCGDRTWIIGPHALLVPDATRSDPDRYARALGAFRDGVTDRP